MGSNSNIGGSNSTVNNDVLLQVYNGPDTNLDSYLVTHLIIHLDNNGIAQLDILTIINTMSLE